MSKQQAGWKNILLNAGLVGSGLLMIVLLYGLGMKLMAPDVNPKREEKPAYLVSDIIQVEVRNGCGVDNLAAKTTRYLRGQGFDVVEVGDHVSFDQAESVVIDRGGGSMAARKVAAVLGLGEDRIRQELRPELYLDVSVILGKDYATLKPFAKD